MTEEVTVCEVKEATADVLANVNRLMPQLTTRAKTLPMSYLETLIANPYVHLYFIFSAGSQPVGMGTLCLCSSPIGVKAWIEDVVIEESVRGMGFGRKLVLFLRQQAELLGAKAVVLTSRPHRVAANRLYASLGFEQCDTNVYRYTTESGQQINNK